MLDLMTSCMKTLMCSGTSSGCVGPTSLPLRLSASSMIFAKEALGQELKVLALVSLRLLRLLPRDSSLGMLNI